MTPAEEKALIDRARQDPRAFGGIYDAFFEPLFRYILHCVAHEPLAEDLTAQTFFKALDNLWKFRWKGISISSWLYRIAGNEVRTHLRKNKNLRFLPLHRSMDLPSAGPSPSDGVMGTAEQALNREDAFLALHACLQKLGPDDHLLIVLRYFENKPFSEIARILKKREGTLRMRVSRTLKKLKLLLERRGIQDERPGRNTPNPAKTRSPGGRLQARPATQPD